MRGKRKRFWAALLIVALLGQHVSGVCAADVEQVEAEVTEALETAEEGREAALKEEVAAEPAEAAAAESGKSVPETGAAVEKENAPEQTETPAAAKETAPEQTKTPAAEDAVAAPEKPKAKETECVETETVSDAARRDTEAEKAETPAAETQPQTDLETQARETEAFSTEAGENGTETEAGLKAETGMEAGTGAEAGSGAEAGAGTEAGSGAETGTGTEAGSGAEAGTGTETGSRAEAENGTETEADNETGTEAGTEAGAGTGTEAGTGAEITTGAGTVVETEIASEAGAGVETEIATEAGTGVETEIASEAGTGTETEIASEAESGTEAETELETGTETESETESEIESETESETEKEAVLGGAVRQEVFPEEDGSLSVKYTIEVRNLTPDADAEDIAVIAVLGQQAVYYSREGQTPHMQYIDAGAQNPDSLDWAGLSACAGELRSCSGALCWEKQSIAAGAAAEYVFFARVGDEAESMDDVKMICFVNGRQVPEERMVWINGEQIRPRYARPQTYTYADAQVTVEVAVPEGVRLPYGTELCVTPVLEGSAEYEAAVAAVESANEDKSFAEHVLYDINFVCDGQIVEPEGGDVFVSMEFARPALQIREAPAEILEDEVVVSHILEDETVENVTREVQTAEDGAVEQVAFATGSFTVYALSRSVTYNGVFNNLGVAEVQLGDGTKIRVEGFWGWFPEGSLVKITPLTLKFPYRVAHGELKNGLGYQIVITDAAGKVLAPANSDYAVTITKADGFGFEALGQGVKGIRSNALSVLEADPGATCTGTECRISNIIPGADSRVLIGSWDYSGDTFLSTGGSYSLGYILNKYNAFIGEDLTGTHIVGPVVAGGAVSVSLGGSTTDVRYPHDVPDYAGTYPHSSGTVTTYSDIPVYFGTAAEGRAYSLLGAAGEYDDYYFAKKFADFDAALSSLQAEAAGFNGESVEESGATVRLAMGGKYTFTAAQLSGIGTLDLQGTFGDGRDTFIIVKDRAAVGIPKIMVNGKELESIEAGMGSGVVFLFPYATAVSGTNVSGHIVAPDARVNLTGGYFNGCIIARSLNTSAEGHMWNYNGSALLPGSVAPRAGKTVDGKTPNAEQDGLFTFVLEEFATADGKGEWKQIQSVNNRGGSVDFAEMFYTMAGTHWYRIRETGQVEGYTLDSTQYVIKVAVSVAGGQIEKTVTYYEVIAAEELIREGAVNEAALRQLASSGSGADVLKFDNCSVTPVTPVPDTVSRTVTKVWRDGNNQDNGRPEKIEAVLKADGAVFGDAAELSEENGWSHTWTGLPKYQDGTDREIVYTVEEKAPAAGYKAQYSQDTFTITNTRTTEVRGEKTWADVPEGVTKPAVTIELLRNGTKVDEQTLVGDAYAFTDLEKYGEDGGEYTYTVREKMSGANADRFVSSQDGNGNFTNRYLTFTVNKVALGNGEELDGAEIVVIDKETGRELAGWTSAKGETHDFGDVLTPGRDYILREKIAPQGYNYTTDTEFRVGEDGTVTSSVQPVTDGKGNKVYLVQDGITVLSILKVDKKGNGVSGARLMIKDAAGNPITDEKGAPKYIWTTDGRPHVLEGIPAGSYILSEKTAPAGYEPAKDVPFTVTNEKDAVNVVTMVDERSTATGSLTVTKTLRLAGMNLEIIAPEAVFYVALFADEARTERISEAKAIEFRNQSAGKAVFENLKAGTYYVGETDADGNLLELGFVEMVGFEPVYGNGYAVELESDTFAGQLSFDNVFHDLPHGFLYEFFLDITKEVVKNGEPYETDEMFYAGVFYDAAFTELYELVALPMNGGSGTTVEIPVPVGADPSEAVTLYVTEVDENGVPLKNGRELGFRFSVDHTEVKVSGYNPRDAVVIVNDYSGEEIETEIETETETETETESESETEAGTGQETGTEKKTRAETEAKRAVQTGDDTDYRTYLWLLGISAGALLLGVSGERKRKK